MSSAVATSTSIGALVRRRAETQQAHCALVVDDGSSLTLGEWLRRAEHVARVLAGRGVEPGQRVALVISEGDWIGYAVANLAVYLTGATAVGLTDRLGADAVSGCVAECDCSAVLHSASVVAPRPPVVTAPPVPAVPPVPPLFAPAPRWWAIDELEAVDGVEVQLPDPDSVDPEALAEIAYTSGTTGAPKRVAVTHANLTFGRDSSGELFGGIESILCAVPPGTNAGHSALVVAMTTGSRAHLLRRIDADSVGAAVERHAIQHAILPPGIAADLVRSGAWRRYDLSSLRALMFGSSAVPDAIVCRLSQAIPTANIMIGYGSTESAPAFARRTEPAWREHRDESRFRRIGWESLGSAGGGTEVRIVGTDGAPVAPGTVGEIALRSEAPCRYYLDDEPRTAGVFGPHGWVRTGDLGTIDEDGTLRFVDRSAESIVVGGHRVSSAMVENALMWHPAVRAAAVFGVADERWGQRAIAAVRAEPGTDPAQLASFLDGELEPPDRPSEIVLVDDFPLGVTGKVRKAELRTRYADTGGRLEHHPDR